MSDRSHRFGSPHGLEALGAERRQLVLDTCARLEAWIDDNVDRLESEAKAAIEAKRQEMAAQASAVRAELAAAKERLADVLARLGTLEESFEAGDGLTVDEAVRATREAVTSARRVIDEREQRMNELVQGILAVGLQSLSEI